MSILSRAAALALAVASVALPAHAADDAAAATPPPIEIVRDGGVAETWREDGGDFATYGPDGEAVKPTAQAQALQALTASYSVQFVALDGGAEIGRVPVHSAAQNALARQILGDWLRESADARAGCAPEFRHALAFSADGHEWEVRLDYGCGLYSIRRDGTEIAAATTADAAGRADFDAVIATPARGEG